MEAFDMMAKAIAILILVITGSFAIALITVLTHLIIKRLWKIFR